MAKPKHFDDFAQHLSGGAIGIDATDRSNFWRKYGDLLIKTGDICAYMDSVGLPPVARALKSVWENRESRENQDFSVLT